MFSTQLLAVQVGWDKTTAFDMQRDTFPMIPAGGDNITHILLDDNVVPDYMLQMIPMQMHVHTVSEHSRGGLLVCSVLLRACHPRRLHQSATDYNCQ
jgi:hypothetical protein